MLEAFPLWEANDSCDGFKERCGPEDVVPSSVAGVVSRGLEVGKVAGTEVTVAVMVLLLLVSSVIVRSW